jgi:antitoxin MazE
MPCPTGKFPGQVGEVARFIWLERGAMRAVVKKWGNSASVRIPKIILRSVRIGVDDAVELREESGRIVIEPLQRIEFVLAELLDGITRRNVHCEIDVASPVGNEVW